MEKSTAWSFLSNPPEIPTPDVWVKKSRSLRLEARHPRKGKLGVHRGFS